ncbi:MAG: SGNH/GDSL hydrolase family protein [Candidatus Thorarchaeota archaeon]|jgi:lysophospholipase L1-like esterase
MNANNQIEILCFGDSLTAGTPGYDPMFGGNERFQYGYWLTELAHSEGWNSLSFRNHGVPGDLARSMPSRLRRTIVEGRYDATIILAGSNDLGWDYSPASVYSSLQDLWRIAIDSGLGTVSCTIPPIGMEYPPIQLAQRNLNEMIRGGSKDKQNLVCADVFTALADEKGLLPREYDSGDCLHLSMPGYRRLGEVIWGKGLRPLLEK